MKVKKSIVEKNVFIDTSGWVALFLKNDKNHKEAVCIYETINSSGMKVVTSDYVLDETVTMLTKKLGARQSIEIGDSLILSDIIKIIFINPDCFHSAWQYYHKFKDKKFSFTDVTSFYIMKEFGISKAFSFDGHFKQAGLELL